MNIFLYYSESFFLKIYNKNSRPFNIVIQILNKDFFKHSSCSRIITSMSDLLILHFSEDNNFQIIDMQTCLAMHIKYICLKYIFYKETIYKSVRYTNYMAKPTIYRKTLRKKLPLFIYENND